MSVSPTCLYAPSGAFLTDELWLVDSAAANWVEVGYLVKGSNLNIGGITASGTFGFYADQRPGGGFHAHVLTNGPSLNFTFLNIYKTATNTYAAQFGSATGYSTNNSMTPQHLDYGSESSSNSSRGYSFARVVGYQTNGVGESGMVNPSWGATSPQQFAFISPYTSYNAGIAC